MFIHVIYALTTPIQEGIILEKKLFFLIYCFRECPVFLVTVARMDP